MPGGEKASWLRVRDLLQSISAKDKQGNSCCEWIGPGGSGHFIKMVHNGIEYSMMQIIAEAYDFLVKIILMSNLEVLSLFKTWRGTDLDSYLIGITCEVLSTEEVDGKPLIENVLDIVDQKGTGKDTTMPFSKAEITVSFPVPF
jgi:6-phosphogluconate dehydrogenase